MITWERWEKDLQVPGVGLFWDDIVKIRWDFLSAKAQAFHWHFINRALVTNKLRYNMKQIASPFCSFCHTEEETIIHLFWECPQVKNLWRQLFDWCSIYVSAEIEYNCPRSLLFGYKHIPLNNIMLMCKYYIFTQQLFQDRLLFKVLLNRIQNARYKDSIACEYLPYLTKKRYFKLWGKIPTEAFKVDV